MMTAKIRPAQENDCELILYFIKQLAIFEKLEHEVKATTESLKQTLFGKHPCAEVIFLEDDKTPLGFALFFHNYSTFLAQPGIYLEDLFVLPEYRGKGYGKRLLSYLANLALERQCGRFEWSVLDWNTPAIEFYKSIGAQALNQWVGQRVTGEALKNLAQFYENP